jgi:hypothetical protein
VIGLPALWCGAAAAGPSDLKPVTITITALKVKVDATSVSVGPEIFKIINRSRTARVFTLAGQATRRIGAGQSTALAVTIPSGATYVYYSVAPWRPRIVRGAFSVVEPCINPTESTITVRLAEMPIALSQTSVPCGTVTFAITNVGTVVHGFTVIQQNPPRTLAAAPQLQPGQTTDLVVRFAQKGQVGYFCPQTEHTEIYGELGTLTVT